MSIFPNWYILCVFGADDFQMNRGASLFYKKKKNILLCIVGFTSSSFTNYQRFFFPRFQKHNLSKKLIKCLPKYGI